MKSFVPALALAKVSVMLASLLALLGGGVWYRTRVDSGHAIASNADSVCESCLAGGKDYCVSSSKCVERATFSCAGPWDHITGDPEFAKGNFSHDHHHGHWHEHHHGHHDHEHHHGDHDHEHHHGDHDHDGHGDHDDDHDRRLHGHHEHHHGHHHHHPTHSMVCPKASSPAMQKNFHEEHQRPRCACGKAKRQCFRENGEAITDGECKELWRECAEKKKAHEAQWSQWSHEKAAAGEHLQGKECPCGAAKKQCMTPEGEKTFEGECAQKWEECSKKMAEWHKEPACATAKTQCMTADGKKVFEGDCAMKWDICGKTLGFMAPTQGVAKDGAKTGAAGCPCGDAKKQCILPDGSKNFDGECQAMWGRCFMRKPHGKHHHARDSMEQFGVDPSPMRSPWRLVEFCKNWVIQKLFEESSDKPPATKAEAPDTPMTTPADKPLPAVEPVESEDDATDLEEENAFAAFVRHMQAVP